MCVLNVYIKCIAKEKQKESVLFCFVFLVIKYKISSIPGILGHQGQNEEIRKRRKRWDLQPQKYAEEGVRHWGLKTTEATVSGTMETPWFPAKQAAASPGLTQESRSWKTGCGIHFTLIRS